MFLFVASAGSRGHLTSALKHDLTKDCVTIFLLVIHINLGQSVPLLLRLHAAMTVLIWVHGLRRKTFIVMNHKSAFLNCTRQLTNQASEH